jgi:hypothetical protein
MNDVVFGKLPYSVVLMVVVAVAVDVDPVAHLVVAAADDVVLVERVERRCPIGCDVSTTSLE